MNKKILMSIGALALATPIAAVLSCSNSDTDGETINLKNNSNLLSSKLFKKNNDDDINKEDFGDTLVTKNDHIIKEAVDDTNEIIKDENGKIRVIIAYNDAEIEVDVQIKVESKTPKVNVNKVYLTKNDESKSEDTSSKPKISAFKKYTKNFILALIEVGKDPNILEKGIAEKVKTEISTI